MKKPLLLMGFLLLTSLLFVGCRTAEGFGHDVERAGEEIQDVVD